MSEADFESDAFLSLLTEALRSGPGSPPWHEALRRLRGGGIEHADEYRLLVTAREHLESGKDYRSVRAGPGFTRRLMSAIDDETARGPRKPATPATIAVASAAVMLGVLLLIGYLLWTAAENRSGTGDMTVLVNTITASEFINPPPDWRIVGPLPIELARGSMRHIPTSNPGATTGGAGLFWNQAIPPDERFAISVNVRVRRIEENLIAQVVISDDPQFNPENSTTPHELVWLFASNQARVVLPSGRIEAQSDVPIDYRGMLPLRITIDRDQATFDVDNKRQWSGPNGLDPSKPRYIGLRFLRRAPDAGDGVVFQSLRVNTRQK